MNRLVYFSVNRDHKEIAFPVVGEGDLRPVGQGTFDTRPQAPVGQQPLGDAGDQNRVAEIRLDMLNLRQDKSTIRLDVPDGLK